jgi:hypothetical protein
MTPRGAIASAPEGGTVSGDGWFGRVERKVTPAGSSALSENHHVCGLSPGRRCLTGHPAGYCPTREPRSDLLVTTIVRRRSPPFMGVGR